MKSLNLALRFFLEIVTWIAPGLWAWHFFDGASAYLFALLLPLLMISLWGIFNVPNDPSRGGKAPIVVPGKIRLVLELTEFSLGLWAWQAAGYPNFAWLILALLVLHHILLKDRLIWIWKA